MQPADALGPLRGAGQDIRIEITRIGRQYGIGPKKAVKRREKQGFNGQIVENRFNHQIGCGKILCRRTDRK